MKSTIIACPSQTGAGTPAISLLFLSLQLFILLLPARLPGQAEPSALLELQSTDSGFLLPRMTQAQRDAIASPATGLMIYNTTAFCLEVNHGSPSAPLWWPFSCAGSIGSLSCSVSAVNGALANGIPTTFTLSLPYTGGNGGPYNGQTVTSSGVAGLTATLASGSFVNGAGNLVYTIAGTAASSGTASFALNIGGQTCTLNVAVGCGAYIAPNQWKEFMCHNLAAANTSANPFIPSWELVGGYWQWGRAAMAAPGPAGSSGSQANQFAINGWNATSAPSSAWADSTKTSNDPCPNGFRIPTNTHWDGVIANNTQSITGNWGSSSSNYSSARFFGPNLMLPAAGYRDYSNGALQYRGYYGYYGSSSALSSTYSGMLDFDSSWALTNYNDPRIGFSIRCIAE